MIRVIAYVDGFNLYFGLRSKGWRRYYWLNPWVMAQNLLKPGQQLEAVKYFTARISADTGDPGKRRRQSSWLEAVETVVGVQVIYGHYLPKPLKCHSCGATWISHEEKMTDVNMAVEILRDAFDDAFDTALLISADSDLAPVLEAIRARLPAKRVIVVCPPDRQSKKLESVATATFRLGRKVLQESQLPDQYVKPGGFVLRRPVTWK